MKFIIIACAIVVAAQAVSAEVKEKIKGFQEPCITETGVQKEAVEKINKGEHAEDPNLNAFSFCVMSKMEIIDDSGNFKKDTILSMVEDGDKEQATETLEKCTAKLGAVTKQNAFEHCKCYNAAMPNSSLA